ncbi:BMN2 family [Babesia microti strain RI]|uniref:BMN2 family n=1 Tax=Babesia microti (strain RI) TaxID=1133968 RepID=I7I8G9_BABMR|nr:BMN2 family [Babesia microti strain RI]CCF73168.1 BMN2 family [Babesia microti strain RI]|eukprot:XP_012647777.1 BMN2 family [Babesia microti strain RI]
MKINIDKIILINLIVLLNRNVLYCVYTNDVSLIESQPVPTNIGTDNTIANASNSTIIKAKFLRDYDLTGEPLTRKIDYEIYESQRNKLSHPNKIDKIKFFNYIIEFDDNAKLPIGTVINIIIYTCEHNNPVLIKFYVSIEGSLYNYFYSMDNDTNKWNNHKLKYDNRFKEYTDKNGINYYEISDLKSCFSCFFVNKEYTALAKEHCKKEKCEMLDNIEYKNLEIYLK